MAGRVNVGGSVIEPPRIVVQLQCQTVVEGGLVGFGVKASGAEPLRYQWQKEGKDLAGATDCAPYRCSEKRPIPSSACRARSARSQSV